MTDREADPSTLPWRFAGETRRMRLGARTDSRGFEVAIGI
jgi:hypothetical protein